MCVVYHILLYRDIYVEQSTFSSNKIKQRKHVVKLNKSLCSIFFFFCWTQVQPLVLYILTTKINQSSMSTLNKQVPEINRLSQSMCNSLQVPQCRHLLIINRGNTATQTPLILSSAAKVHFFLSINVQTWMKWFFFVSLFVFYLLIFYIFPFFSFPNSFSLVSSHFLLQFLLQVMIYFYSFIYFTKGSDFRHDIKMNNLFSGVSSGPALGINRKQKYYKRLILTGKFDKQQVWETDGDFSYNVAENI